MTTLVKLGTARRLGLRPADPLKHYRQRWVQSASWDIPLPPVWSLSSEVPGKRGTFYIGETRLS